jgi:hypothetical protein
MEHVKLDSKLKIAALTRETEAVAELTIATESASIARTAAREAIRHHEESAHPDKGEPATTGS